jgi:hypothetical protein
MESKSTSADVDILIVKHEVQVQAIPNPIINMTENIFLFNKLVFCNTNVSIFLHVNTKDYHVFRRFYTMCIENKYL